MARFDWYQATVPSEVGPLLASLEGAATGSPRWEDMRKAPQGYAFGRPRPMAEYFAEAEIGASGPGIRPQLEPASED